MRVAAVLYIIIAILYLLWRPTVFNPHAFLFSLIFYAADVYCCLLGMSMIYISWNIRVRDVLPVPARRPTVDVFLPVYTEPADMIELTVIGAKEIDYPHETFLLDDGRRPEIRALAEKHGVRYVTRPDNRGAKAGNLNHALTLSTAEFVAVFDADHIPKRESLEMLLGHLEDPQVGMSHAPQTYYNEDGFLYRDVYIASARWHEQSHCMDVFQSSRDQYDGSSGVGTGVIYRRSAMDLIGGFPEATLTEDLHTSLLMHKRGLKTVWLNEPVAWGVAAADISEFYKTRRRWTYGNLQAFARENLLFCKELPWRQRMGYLTMGFEMLSGWYQLIYLLTPAFAMVFYVTPFQPTPLASWIVLTMPTLQMLLQMMVSGGYLRFIPCQIFSMGKMFLQIESTRGLLGKKMAWQVSLKNVLGSVAMGKLAAHILVLGASLLALTYALLRYVGVITNVVEPVGGRVMLLVSSAWVVFNTWRSWRWITDSVRYTRQTHREYLFEVRLPVLNQAGEWIGSTTRLSTQQMEVAWFAGLEGPRPGAEIQVLIPGHTVRMFIAEGGAPGLPEVRCADESSRDLLRRSLYSVDWHRMVRLSAHSYMAREKGLGGKWEPVVVSTAGRVPHWGLWLSARSDGLPPCIMLEGDRSTGDTLMLLTMQDGRLKERHIVLLDLIVPARPVPRGLNDNSFSFFLFDLAPQH